MMVSYPQYSEVCRPNELCTGTRKKGSLMMKIPFLSLPACSKKTIESRFSRLQLNDIFSFLEIRLLLMTQVLLCSWVFLIVQAAAFSFLFSRTLKISSPGQSDHLIFTLINDKFTELSQMEVTASMTCTFSFT